MLGFAATGAVGFSIAVSRSLERVGGCPTHEFPVRPRSAMHQHSPITVGGTTGCWTAYVEPQPTSEQAVFGYYMDDAHTRGWSLLVAYPNTRYASFRSTADPDVRAEVDVMTLQTYFVAGPPIVRLSISLCTCDPLERGQWTLARAAWPAALL